MTRDLRRFSIPHGRRALVSAIAAAALILPWNVTAESTLSSGARTASTGATAHLDFRIVIPPVLALSVEGVGEPRVSVLSNTRHVLLTASPPVLADELARAAGASAATGPTPRASDAATGTHHTMWVTSRRSGVIVAETACRLDAPRTVAIPGRRQGAAIVDLRPVVCTVAMP
jgi:hypothetical protein